MDAILEDATIRQRRQTLHKMTNGFGLDDAYSTTLDRIREQRGNRVSESWNGINDVDFMLRTPAKSRRALPCIGGRSRNNRPH